MDHEYGSIIDVIEIKPGVADLTREEFGDTFAPSFAHVIQRVTSGAATLKGGGWEIISHDLARFDRYLLVTFVLRRPVQSK